MTGTLWQVTMERKEAEAMAISLERLLEITGGAKIPERTPEERERWLERTQKGLEEYQRGLKERKSRTQENPQSKP